MHTRGFGYSYTGTKVRSVFTCTPRPLYTAGSNFDSNSRSGYAGSRTSSTRGEEKNRCTCTESNTGRTARSVTILPETPLLLAVVTDKYFIHTYVR